MYRRQVHLFWGKIQEPHFILRGKEMIFVYILDNSLDFSIKISSFWVTKAEEGGEEKKDDLFVNFPSFCLFVSIFLCFFSSYVRFWLMGFDFFFMLLQSLLIKSGLEYQCLSHRSWGQSFYCFKNLVSLFNFLLISEFDFVGLL